MAAQKLKPERLSHTNRHGETFYIRMRKTSRGVRYFMVRDPGGALSRLPDGYQIVESVNGRVSILRAQQARIAPQEMELVRAALRQLSTTCYKADVHGRFITIYASADDCRSFAQSIDAEFAEGFAAALECMFARKYGQELADLFRSRRTARDGTKPAPQYYPLLRFTLVNARARKFAVQRIYFTGDADWLQLEVLPLPAAVMKYVPHLGQNSFFDLL
jgi:hypothetical protein